MKAYAVKAQINLTIWQKFRDETPFVFCNFSERGDFQMPLKSSCSLIITLGNEDTKRVTLVAKE